MNPTRWSVALGWIALVLAAGCAGAPSSPRIPREAAGPRPGAGTQGSSGWSWEHPVLLAEAGPPAEAPAAEPEDGEEPEPRAVADAAVEGGPSLIYQAQVNLAAHEVRERMARVIEIAEQQGGFLAAQDDTSVVIRVPRRRFRQALEQVVTQGDLLRRQISAEDVSDEERDLRIRLQSAVEMRDRLADLLERAETVPESLTIEQELERITVTIEQHRGQLRVMQDRVAFSTITVRFQPVRQDQEVPRERFSLPFPWLNDLGLQNLMRL